MKQSAAVALVLALVLPASVAAQPRTHDACLAFVPDALFDRMPTPPFPDEDSEDIASGHRYAALALLSPEFVSNSDGAGAFETSSEYSGIPEWSMPLLAARPPDNGRDGHAVIFPDTFSFRVVEADTLAARSLVRAVRILRRNPDTPDDALAAALNAYHGGSERCDPAGRGLAALAIAEALVSLAHREDPAPLANLTRLDAEETGPFTLGRLVMSGAYFDYALRWALIAHDANLDRPLILLRALELAAMAEPSLRETPDAPPAAAVADRFAQAPQHLGALSDNPRLSAAEAMLREGISGAPR